MEKIPLFIYVAHNNPNGAVKVMNHFGLMPPKEETDLVRGLREVMMVYGEEGFMEIAKHHPDRNLIIDAEEIRNSKLVPIIEPTPICETCEKNKTKSNASGVDGLEIPITKIQTAPQLTKEDINTEVKKALKETSSNPFLEKGLPYLALIGLSAFVIIKMLPSK